MSLATQHLSAVDGGENSRRRPLRWRSARLTGLGGRPGSAEVTKHPRLRRWARDGGGTGTGQGGVDGIATGHRVHHSSTCGAGATNGTNQTPMLQS